MDRVVPPFPVNANHSHESCGVLGRFHQHSPGRERYSNLATFAKRARQNLLIVGAGRSRDASDFIGGETNWHDPALGFALGKSWSAQLFWPNSLCHVL